MAERHVRLVAPRRLRDAAASSALRHPDGRLRASGDLRRRKSPSPVASRRAGPVRTDVEGGRAINSGDRTPAAASAGDGCGRASIKLMAAETYITAVYPRRCS